MGRAEIQGIKKIIIGTPIVLLTILTTIASVAGGVHPSTSTIMPLLGMALPVLIVINIAAMIICILLRSKLFLLPLLALGMNYSFLSSMIQFGFSKEFTTDKLTIVTYNVHGFGSEIRGYSCRQMAREMQMREVDIICFQEFYGKPEFPLDSIKKTLKQWPYSYIPYQEESKGKLPIAIFSRHPIREKGYIAYPESNNCSQWCDIEVKGKEFRIFNNHLQTTHITQRRSKWQRELESNEKEREIGAINDAANTLHDNLLKRAAQADSLYKLIQASPHPVILAGDLNSLPSSYTYHKLTSLLKDGFKSGGNGYMYTYKYGKNLFRIDYLMHAPELECIAYDSPDWELSSDHNPVFMTIRMF